MRRCVTDETRIIHPQGKIKNWYILQRLGLRKGINMKPKPVSVAEGDS